MPILVGIWVTPSFHQPLLVVFLLLEDHIWLGKLMSQGNQTQSRPCTESAEQGQWAASPPWVKFTSMSLKVTSVWDPAVGDLSSMPFSFLVMVSQTRDSEKAKLHTSLESSMGIAIPSQWQQQPLINEEPGLRERRCGSVGVRAQLGWGTGLPSVRPLHAPTHTHSCPTPSTRPHPPGPKGQIIFWCIYST